MAKNPLELVKTTDLDKIGESLANAGFDVYQDSESDLSAYDNGDAIRDYDIRLKDGKLQFKTLHVDEKYRGKGWANKLIDATLKGLDPSYQIEVIASINDDFWKHMASKYPNFKWSIK